MEEHEINDLLYDEVEEKIRSLEQKKQNRKKKRKKIRYSFLAIFISLAVLYFVSDISKVKSLQVSGNTLYTSDQILAKGGLSYQTRYILVPKFYIEMKLKSDKFIKDVTVYKGIDGAISLQVLEEDIVGIYQENSDSYILLANGESEKITDEHKNAVLYYPGLGTFEADQKTALAGAFEEYFKDDKSDAIKLISEIQPFVASYNANMVEMIMQDGNRLFASYSSIPLISEYQNVLKNLKGTRACLLLDDATSSITSIDCQSMDKKEAPKT